MVPNRFDAFDVAMQPDGDFLVVWDRSLFGVSARLFNADGTPKNEILSLHPDASFPTVSAGPDGRFIVAYQIPLFLQFSEVRTRRLDAEGRPEGAETVIGIGAGSEVVATSDGGFIVAWIYNDPSFTLTHEVRLRRFNAADEPLGPDPQVINGDPDDGILRDVSVVSAPGGFAVVWAGDKIAPDRALTARRFGLDGVATGPPVELDRFVNPPVTRIYRLDAAYDEEGRLVATWEIDDEVFAQGLAPGTDTPEPKAQIDLGKDVFNGASYVAALGKGRFLVAFQSGISLGDDDDIASIQAQRLVVSDLFRDGFESGDVLAWSQVTGSNGCPLASCRFAGGPQHD
ncbi:MAG: hypothetical protein AAGD06_32515 [Acidobacteriota bacterium]